MGACAVDIEFAIGRAQLHRVGERDDGFIRHAGEQPRIARLGEIDAALVEAGDALRAVEFPRIKGGKAFDTDVAWFTDLLSALERAYALREQARRLAESVAMFRVAQAAPGTTH